MHHSGLMHVGMHFDACRSQHISHSKLVDLIFVLQSELNKTLCLQEKLFVCYTYGMKDQTPLSDPSGVILHLHCSMQPYQAF